MGTSSTCSKATLKAESDSRKKIRPIVPNIFFCIFEKISEKVFFRRWRFVNAGKFLKDLSGKKYSEEDLGRICDLNKGLAEVKVITTADQKSEF